MKIDLLPAEEPVPSRCVCNLNIAEKVSRLLQVCSVCLLPSLLRRECSAVELTIRVVGVSPAQRAHTYLYSLHYLLARKTLPAANRVTLLNKAWRRGPPAPLLINYERVF